VNPLWGIEYEQFVRGCHLGIFPSAYEPWGYTPLECVAMGVPAVTSDLAGFGRYVAETYPDHDHWGVNLLARRGRSFDEAAADLTTKLLEFCRLDRRGRIALRHEVQQRAREFDWPKLVAAYHRAHDRALALRI
jgi:glycogen(starch) synthase